MLLSTSVVLALSMISIIVVDSFDYYQRRVADLRTQADILGKTSTAALAFNDPKAAHEYLSALKAKPSISAAALYGHDGSLFTSYIRKGTQVVFPPVQMNHHRLDGQDVELFYRIEQDGEVIGTVYLRTSLNLQDRILHYAGFLLLVMALSLVVGSWIADWLQKFISAPILNIASVATAVIEKKNYSLRATRRSNDEIGMLTDAFNQMLAHIEERDEKLLTANRALQQEIEERKHVQDALRKNMQELARSNAELEQFAYVSSHDLQEPLRMVASYTQLLEKRYRAGFDEKGLLYLHYIVDGAKRMQQLINDLLMFSRVGTRGKELQPISSQSVLAVALHNLKPAIDESNARVEHDDLPMVMGDATQLTQLFQNLVSNGIKFHGDKAPKIQIRVTRQNDFWQFMVQDNGIGIDPEHFERIFVIFQRLHGREDYPGSGIGLAICKKIVDRHGGSIWVESGEEKGSTFYFTLKAA